MPSPLFLAAASFFAVIIVGSLLVAVNDWLERRQADPQLAAWIDLRRSARPLLARSRRRTVRTAARLNRQEPRFKRPDLVVDWF